MSRFTLDLAVAANSISHVDSFISVSRSNELFDEFVRCGANLVPVNTFDSPLGVLRIDRLLSLRATLREKIAQHRIQQVICLMPHIWSPMVTGVLRGLGCRYSVVVHDALPHPGDPTASLNGWLMQDVRNADTIFTLSEAVAGRLSATGLIPWQKVFTLFHPDMNYGPPVNPSYTPEAEPLKIAFFGRVLRYKGLPLLLDAIEMMRQNRVRVDLGVFGEGDIRHVTDRLQQLDAEVENRWIADSEVRTLLGRYHAVVLSHTEASQSGVIAAAHGLGMPVITTPVGGLEEQVVHNSTGIVAEHADAPSLAKAIGSLASNPDLYRHLCETVARTKDQRSMVRFVVDLVAQARFEGKVENLGKASQV